MTNEDFFCDDGVDNRCLNPIRERFKVLFDSKKIIQQNLANDLSLDKAYISRIINGVEIPPHHIRLKISSYFNCDSSTIWRTKDLDFIRKLLLEQNKKGEKNGK